jgi:hypothetical protein
VLDGAVDLEGPAARLAGVGAQRQAGVAGELVRVARRARALQVGRGGHAQAAVVGQPRADQAGVGQVAHAHRAVEALVDDVDHAVAEVERQAQVGMLGQEARHQRRHVAAAEAGRRRDAQMAAGLEPARADGGLGVGQRGQQALAVLQEGLPSGVSVSRRVVRSSSLTPSRASSASSRRPMTAGATPSAWAAAVRLPLAATRTKDSICLSLSMPRLCRPAGAKKRFHEASLRFGHR